MTPNCHVLRWAALLLGVGGVLLSGCDGGASKRASLSKQLSGPWEIQCVRYDNFGCESQSVDVLLEVEEGSGAKDYRLVETDGGETVLGRGQIEVVRDNTLRMTGTFTPRSLIWTFDFSLPDDLRSSVRWTLQPRYEEDADEILDVLGLSGGATRVELDLVRPSS